MAACDLLVQCIGFPSSFRISCSRFGTIHTDPAAGHVQQERNERYLSVRVHEGQVRVGRMDLVIEYVSQLVDEIRVPSQNFMHDLWVGTVSDPLYP